MSCAIMLFFQFVAVIGWRDAGGAGLFAGRTGVLPAVPDERGYHKGADGRYRFPRETVSECGAEFCPDDVTGEMVAVFAVVSEGAGEVVAGDTHADVGGSGCPVLVEVTGVAVSHERESGFNVAIEQVLPYAECDCGAYDRVARCVFPSPAQVGRAVYGGKVPFFEMQVHFLIMFLFPVGVHGGIAHPQPGQPDFGREGVSCRDGNIP